MIDFYGYGTANGRKVALMLEENGLPYTYRHLDMAKGADQSPEFLAINPVGKMPAIVDHDGPRGHPLKVFETMAIALYLAEKSGNLLPKDAGKRTIAYERATHIAANLAPVFSIQFYLSTRIKGENQHVTDFYIGQIHRCLKPIEQRLAEAPFIASADYSFVDTLLYPIMAVSGARLADGGLDPYPRIRAWMQVVSERPAVKRGMNVIPKIAD